MQTTKVTLYYANWCGHCRDFKPEWFKFKLAYDASKEDIKRKYRTELIINDYESDTNPTEVSQAGVNGFPTIQIERNNRKDEYAGERSAVALFKKVIPDVDPNDIDAWVIKAAGANSRQQGGTPRLQANANKAKAGRSNDMYGPSYKKFLKYKMKYESYIRNKNQDV